MKKTLLLILTTLFIFSGSAFAQENIAESDEYIDSVEENTIQKTKKEKKSNSFFSSDNDKKFIYGNESTVFTKNLTNSLKQQKLNVIINKTTNNAGYGSPFLAAYYKVTMEKEAIESIRKAFEFYEKDFEEKRLERNGKKTYKKYGKINIHLDWGTVRISTPNYGTGKAYIGYEFVDKKPYFCITIFPIKNEYSMADDAYNDESSMVKYYFTKAMAKTLLENLSEEELNKLKQIELPVFEEDEVYAE